MSLGMLQLVGLNTPDRSRLTPNNPKQKPDDHERTNVLRAVNTVAAGLGLDDARHRREATDA
jgi:hypothetical protein